MTRRLLKHIVWIFILALVCSCIDDKGNYTYLSSSDIMPIEISGLEKEMTIEVDSTLHLTPELLNMDNPDKYTYEWYVMEYNVAGKAPERRDIGQEKDLNYKVTLDPGVWRLSYKVINPENNVFVRAEIKLSVVATVIDNKGWYILKDNGEETDFDYINMEDVLYKDVLRERELQLPGTAVAMEYQPSGFDYNITDSYGNVVTLINQSAFHVVSTQEIYSFNSKTLKLIFDFQDQFYSVPETCQPQNVVHLGGGFRFLQNNGKIYYVNGVSPNIGKVSPVSGNYNLYKDYIPSGGRECIVFDQTSNSLMLADAYLTELAELAELEQDGSIYSFTNMPYDMVCIGYNMPTQGYKQGYIVMRHKESGEGILLRVFGKYSTSITSLSAIPKESKLLQAKLVTPPQNADFLYFVYGTNHIYSYENASGLPIEDREKEVLSYPEGETITSIRQVFAAQTDNTPQKNQLAVLTTQDGKWKLYLYDLLGESTPEINPEPVKVYEGEGNGRYLLYRSV